MDIVYKKISEIMPYPNNPRINDQAVEGVANSIKEFGFRQPIIIDKNNVIIAGHTRLKAAKKLGLTEVPTIKADDLTPEQVKAFRLVDNKTSELSAWDFSQLENEIASIKDIEMNDFGFEELLAIDDEGLSGSDFTKQYLSFGNKKVEITEEELELLMEKYDSYVDANGVNVGFARFLVCG